MKDGLVFSITSLLHSMPNGGGNFKTLPNYQSGTLLVHDTFTDTDGTLLKDHAISPVNLPGVSWTAVDTNVVVPTTILSNEATYIAPATGFPKYLLKIGYAALTVQAKARSTLFGGIGSQNSLSLRQRDINIGFSANKILEAGIVYYRLVECNSSVPAVVRGNIVSYVPTTIDETITFIDTGSSLDIVGEFTSADFTPYVTTLFKDGAYVGFGTSVVATSGTQYYDDFKVWAT